jgi:hypothetical protein
MQALTITSTIELISAVNVLDQLEYGHRKSNVYLQCPGYVGKPAWLLMVHSCHVI